MIDEEGKKVTSLEKVTQSQIKQEYGNDKKSLNIVGITDGATNIKLRLLSIFGVVITIILDWFHLCKKLRDFMSMIARNKEEKVRHLKTLLQ